MSSHRMRVVRQAGRRELFEGTIPAGVGEHQYICGRCGAPVLMRVGLRRDANAVYRCGKCAAFNVIPETESADPAPPLGFWSSAQ